MIVASRLALLVTTATFLMSAGADADYGPQADVAAVRSSELQAWQNYLGAGNHQRVVIDDVRVCGIYAVLWWRFGESGGMSAYQRVAAETWKRIAHGGGAFGRSMVTSFGASEHCVHALIPAEKDADNLH